MRIKLLLFGVLKDIVGQPRLEIEVEEGKTVEGLKAYLVEQYPKCQQLNSLMIAVNETYAKDTDVLKASDDIAIIPPVSGG